MGKKYESSKKKELYSNINAKQHLTKFSDEKVSVIAIDTNCFIELAKIDPDFQHEKQSEKGFKDTLRDVKRLARNGHVKLVLTKTTVQEIMMNLKPKEQEFMEQYCYIVDEKMCQKIQSDVEYLEKKYKEQNLVNNKGKNWILCDATILGESVSLGLCLMSINTADYFKYDKCSNKKGQNRDEHIAEFNANYFKQMTKRLKPVFPSEFLDTFKTTRYFSDIKLYPATKKNLREVLHLEDIYIDGYVEQYIIDDLNVL